MSRRFARPSSFSAKGPTIVRSRRASPRLYNKMRGGRCWYSASRQSVPTIGSSFDTSIGTRNACAMPWGARPEKRTCSSLAVASPSASASRTAANCVAPSSRQPCGSACSMARPSISDDADMISSSRGEYVAATVILQPAGGWDADERNGIAVDQPVEFAPGDGQRLLDRVDAGKIDDLTADDHENIRRDNAVTVINSGVLPQPAHVGEAGACRGCAHDAMAALHSNDAVKIDRANRTAALLEYFPGPLFHLTLEYAHTWRRGRERYVLEADAHCLGGYFLGLELPDFIVALAGAHLRGAHRGRADTVCVLVDLDGYFDIFRRRAELDHGLERLAPDTAEILRRRVGKHALDHIAHQRQCDANRGNDLGVF